MRIGHFLFLIYNFTDNPSNLKLIICRAGFFFALGNGAAAKATSVAEAEVRRCAICATAGFERLANCGTAGPAKPGNALKIMDISKNCNFHRSLIKNKVTNRGDNFKMLL